MPTPDEARKLDKSLQYEVTPVPFHTHNGIDSPKISTQGGVTSIIAGTAITVSPTQGVGDVTITNIGVTSGVAGTAISLSSGTGAVTINNVGVTSIIAGTNISISPSTGTGAVTVNNTLSGGTSFDKRDHTSVSVNTIQNTDVIVRSLTSIPAMGANDMLIINFQFTPTGGSPTLKLQVGATQLWGLVLPSNVDAFRFQVQLIALNATNSFGGFSFGLRSSGTSIANQAGASVDLSAPFQIDMVIKDTNLTPITDTSQYFDCYRIKG